MVVEHKVKGYEEFNQLIEKLEPNSANEPIFVWFTGSRQENGLSWCPCCVKAEPIIQKSLAVLPKKSHLIHVDVGQKPYWKDLNCPFRKDIPYLMLLPTLLKWRSRLRLDGDKCTYQDSVERFFQRVEDYSKTN